MSNQIPEGFLSKKTPNQQFIRRVYEYGATNFQFGLYYDKLFKGEYLPSRIRYNQFFFFAITGCFLYHVSSKHWQFTDEKKQNLGQRKYYTIGRAFQNTFARSADKAALRKHIQSQNYIL